MKFIGASFFFSYHCLDVVRYRIGPHLFPVLYYRRSDALYKQWGPRVDYASSACHSMHFLIWQTSRPRVDHFWFLIRICIWLFDTSLPHGQLTPENLSYRCGACPRLTMHSLRHDNTDSWYRYRTGYEPRQPCADNDALVSKRQATDRCRSGGLGVEIT